MSASPDTAGRHERELIGPLIALGGLSQSGRSVPGSVGRQGEDSCSSILSSLPPT